MINERSTESARAAATTIDVHHHMFPPGLIAALSAAGIDRIGGEPVAANWSPEASLQLMDRYQIDAAILSMPVPLQFTDAAKCRRLAREINQCGHDYASSAQGRFGFFATLPLPDVEAAVDELRYAFDELHADGVALLTNHAGIYPGDPRLDPLYAELDEREAICFLHPTVPASPNLPAGSGSPVPELQPSLLEFPFDTTRAIASLLVSETLDRFPRVRHIVTHCGGCVSSLANRLIDRRPIVSAYTSMIKRGQTPSIERIEQLTGDAQRDALNHLAALHYDVALSTDEQALAALTNLVPADRLLLGTDFPMAQEIGVHLTLTGLARFQGFTAADRATLRSSNAARLFPRLASAARVMTNAQTPAT
jgi:predicted TIM-barrel fold metal-dependent hydrolase